MFRSRRFRLSLPAAVVLATAAFACARDLRPLNRPDHVVFMVFDQMRPDYVDRFDLPNFKRLRSQSRHYPKAYVGHLAAQTVVSHLVMSTGLRPGELPWTDDAMVDEAGTLGKPGAAYKTTELALAAKWKLLERVPRHQFLAARIQDSLGGKVFAIGEKDYSTQVFGGPWASSIITLKKADGRCTPDGVNVPEYISTNPRFALECREPYGTGATTLYSLDGSHYVPGREPANQGGDIWTADATLEVMNRENWSGLFLTFGAIDKVGHMLGEQTGAGLQSVQTEYRLEPILRIADQQLGRVLDALRDRGLTDRTLIVLTADHGAQHDTFYLGNNGTQSCCAFENSHDLPKPPYWIDHLNQIGKLRTAYVDTQIGLWLDERSPANFAVVTRGMMDISGVTEIYALRREGASYRYEQVHARLDGQPERFRLWARAHSAELAASLAGPAAPDLVGFLADGFGFGRIGDHGGAQEAVQRIPMFIHVPGEPASRRWTPMRLMDLAPEITRILGLASPPR